MSQESRGNARNSTADLPIEKKPLPMISRGARPESRREQLTGLERVGEEGWSEEGCRKGFAQFSTFSAGGAMAE